MLGRRNLRRGAALSQGRPLGSSRATAQGDSERAAADAAALGQRGRLHQLRGQRRAVLCAAGGERSEEHTSELQSLMRISYAVFCLKKKKVSKTIPNMYYI